MKLAVIAAIVQKACFLYGVFFLFTAQKLELEQGRNDSARTGLQPGETVRFWRGRKKALQY